MTCTSGLDVTNRVEDSRIVEVTVGPDHQVYQVHAATLATSESPFLQALLSDRWDPNSDKTVHWDDFDSETAERFLAYLYFGDFPVPDPELLTNAKVKRAAVASQAEQGTGILKSRLSATANTPPSQKASGCFSNRDFPHSAYSYRQPLLALAQLYCFAEYHLCSVLEAKIIQRLEEILLLFDCSQPHATTEIVETAEYVYDNSTSRLSSSNSMCDTLARFAAKNCSTLLRDDFEDLVLEGGDFALDIARKVHEQLLTSKRRAHKI